MDDLFVKQWSELYEKSSFSSIFQSPLFYHFLSQNSFLEPFHISVCSDKNLSGLICGYIVSENNRLTKAFSKRAIILGGALLDDGISDEKLEELLSKLIQYLKKKAIYIEFRNFMDYSGYKQTFEKCGFIYKPHLNYKLFISSPEVMLNRFNESKRRQIKKTESAGVKFVKSNDVSDLEAYYNILKNTYRQKIKLPLFPIEFFLNLMQCDFGHMIVIKKNYEIIGGIFCVNDKNTLFEWFICGSNLSTQGIYPSVFATWSGILHAFNIGCKEFDFMGAGKPGKDYGVREFKSKFGGELVENGRFLYKCSPILYYLGKTAIAVQRII